MKLFFYTGYYWSLSTGLDIPVSFCFEKQRKERGNDTLLTQYSLLTDYPGKTPGGIVQEGQIARALFSHRDQNLAISKIWLNQN